LVKLAVFVVTGMLKDEISKEFGAGRHLSQRPVSKEAKIVHNFFSFVLWPLLESHVLLT